MLDSRIRIALLAALGASVARPAAADDGRPPGPALPPARAVHVGVDAAMTTSPSGPTVSSFGAALRLQGDYRFRSGLGFSVEGGVSSVSLDVDGQHERRGAFPGNLLLGMSFERRPRPQLDVGASLRVGAPLALYPGGIDDNRLAELAYGMAASAQGFREPFVWQTNVVPLILGARARLRALDWLTLTGQLAPAYLISVNQRPSRFALATHLDAAGCFRWFLAHLGVTHFASTLALENRHLDQLALRGGAGAFIDGQRWTLDASIGLDAPYGAFQSAPHPWWGIGIVTELSLGPERP